MQSPQEEIENLAAAENPVTSTVEAESANPSPVNGAAGTQPAIKFGRMFDLKPFRPVDDDLVKLGQAMLIGPDPGEPDLSQRIEGVFGMADLLVFAGVVNPLG